MPWRGGSQFLIKFYNIVGMVGVPIFLFLSGYLDYNSKSTLLNKFKSTFIPLIIWSTITYIISLMINNFFYTSFTNYLRWVLGSGSIYYFVPVLFVCILLARIVNDRGGGLSLLSIALSWQYIPYNEIFTQELNPFNFIFYFSLGRLSRKHNLTGISIYLYVLLIAFLILTFILWDTTNRVCVCIWCPLFCIFLFLLIDVFLRKYPQMWLINIGN